jgi:hypothetical protein
MKKPRFSPSKNNQSIEKTGYQIKCEMEMLKMQFDKKSGDEITLEEVIENCVEELTKFRSKFYDMGNDVQTAEDFCYKIQSFLDYVENAMSNLDERGMPRISDLMEFSYTERDAKVVEIANLCTQNLYGARQLYKSLFVTQQTINLVEKFFDPVYG